MNMIHKLLDYMADVIDRLDAMDTKTAVGLGFLIVFFAIVI